MKKLNFCIAMAATVLASSPAYSGGPEIIQQPDYFTGFYLGGAVSIHNLVSNQNSQFISTTDITVTNLTIPVPPNYNINTTLPAGLSATDENDGGTINIYGGIQGGVGKVFNHKWYLGLVGFGDWGAQQTSSANTTTTPAQVLVNVSANGTTFSTAVVSNSTLLTTSASTKINNDYGVAGKLGYLFTPTTLLYGKIGAEWADITVSSSLTGSNQFSFLNQVIPSTSVSLTSNLAFSGSNTNADTKSTLLLGIGMEQFVYSNIVSFNLEYDYANFGSVSTSGNVLVQGSASGASAGTVTAPQTLNQTLVNALSASANVKISTFLAGLNFYFGRNWL